VLALAVLAVLIVVMACSSSLAVLLLLLLLLSIRLPPCCCRDRSPSRLWLAVDSKNRREEDESMSLGGAGS